MRVSGRTASSATGTGSLPGLGRSAGLSSSEELGPGVQRATPPLPVISGDECIAAFRPFGDAVARQSGSHARLVYNGRALVTVPRHSTIQRGTLRAILRVAISVEEFMAALSS